MVKKNGQFVERKLENTLGLFLSINSFQENAVKMHSNTGSNMILMTGTDLSAVFENRIDFRTLLAKKKSDAAQTGEILIEAHNIS